MRFKPCPWSILCGTGVAIVMGVVVFAQAGNLQPLIEVWAQNSAAPKQPSVKLTDLKNVVTRLEELEAKKAMAPPPMRPVQSPDYAKVTQVLARLEAMEARRLAGAGSAPQASSGQPQSVPRQSGSSGQAAKSSPAPASRRTASDAQSRGTFVKASTSAPISFGTPVTPNSSLIAPMMIQTRSTGSATR